MTSYLLAGGGTAGHVNPMLAIADEIRRTEPEARIVMIGTKEGLEARLVPQRGYDLHTIPRLPFPRRPDARAVKFVRLWRRTVADIAGVIRDRNIDVVIGVGGYAAAPAYVAARKANIPIVIHEANAKPGLANLLAARWTRFVGRLLPEQSFATLAWWECPCAKKLRFWTSTRSAVRLGHTGD